MTPLMTGVGPSHSCQLPKPVRRRSIQSALRQEASFLQRNYARHLSISQAGGAKQTLTRSCSAFHTNPATNPRAITEICSRFWSRVPAYSKRRLYVANASSEHKDPGKGSTSEYVRVKLSAKEKAPFGDTCLLAGSSVALGMWDPNKALPMTWAEGNAWTVTVDVPAGSTVMYKVIRRDSSGNFHWPNGADSVLNATMKREGAAPSTVSQYGHSVEDIAVSRETSNASESSDEEVPAPPTELETVGPSMPEQLGPLEVEPQELSAALAAAVKHLADSGSSGTLNFTTKSMTETAFSASIGESQTSGNGPRKSPTTYEPDDVAVPTVTPTYAEEPPPSEVFEVDTYAGEGPVVDAEVQEEQSYSEPLVQAQKNFDESSADIQAQNGEPVPHGTSEVGRWLLALGLEKYAGIFADYEIETLTDLQYLTEEDFRTELGLPFLPARKIIVQRELLFKQLRKQLPPS